MDKIKIVFLAANPVQTSRLGLDEEIRAITEKVRASQYREALEFVSAWAVRPDDILQVLNTYQPQIVHFSSHGSPAGEILLVGSDGRPKAVSAKALKTVFTTLKDNIRLVVLNACYSRIQAEAIVEVIDCVVGMNDTIGDQAAQLFAASFYRAIGFGRSIQDAFDQGKAALLLEGVPEEDTPELLVKAGRDPTRLMLLDPGGSLASPPLLQGSQLPVSSLLQHASAYQACFLSYASKDQAFAEQLHADLERHGVQCWFAPHDMKIGDKIRQRIEDSIQEHDKLLLVLSEHSVESVWVESEVETAFEKERQQKRLVLFPIRLDDAVMQTKYAWAAEIRRTRHIGDFRGWTQSDAYQKALDQLLRDLQVQARS